MPIFLILATYKKNLDRQKASVFFLKMGKKILKGVLTLTMDGPVSKIAKAFAGLYYSCCSNSKMRLAKYFITCSKNLNF